MKIYSITMVEYREFLIKANSEAEAKELASDRNWEEGIFIDYKITDCDELMDDKGRKER